MQHGIVGDVTTLDAFVRTALRQSATGDGVALLRARESLGMGNMLELVAIDRLVFERKLNEEVRLMTVRMGRKLAELTDGVLRGAIARDFLERVKAGSTPGTHPVALAVVLATLGIDGRDGFAVQQYGVASAILGAALRLMRVSYLDTQRILHAALATTPAAYEEMSAVPPEDMSSFAPTMDALAAMHVKAHVRMFMN